MKQGPAHSTGMRQHSRGYNTSSLHPLPVQVPDTFRLRAHGLNMPLCDLNLCNTHSLPCFSPVSLVVILSPHLQVVSAFLLSLGASVTLGVKSNGTVPNQLKPSAWLAISSPPGGEGTRRHYKKKTQKKGGDACALPDLSGLPFLDALMRVSRRLLAFLHCPIPTTLLVDAPVVRPTQKKNDYTRELQLPRRLIVGNGRTRCYFLAELYLLFVMD